MYKMTLEDEVQFQSISWTRTRFTDDSLMTRLQILYGDNYALKRNLDFSAIAAMTEAVKVAEKAIKSHQTDSIMPFEQSWVKVVHIHELASRLYYAISYQIQYNSYIYGYVDSNEEFQLFEKVRTAYQTWLNLHGELSESQDSNTFKRELNSLKQRVAYMTMLNMLVEYDETYLDTEKRLLKKEFENSDQRGITTVEYYIRQRQNLTKSAFSASDTLSWFTAIINRVEENAMILTDANRANSLLPWKYICDYAFWLEKRLQAIVMRMDIFHFADGRLIDSQDLGYDDCNDFEGSFKCFERFEKHAASFMIIDEWADESDIMDLFNEDIMQATLLTHLLQQEPNRDAAETALMRIAKSWKKNFECMEYFAVMRDQQYYGSASVKTVKTLFAT